MVVIVVAGGEARYSGRWGTAAPNLPPVRVMIFTIQESLLISYVNQRICPARSWSTALSAVHLSVEVIDPTSFHRVIRFAGSRSKTCVLYVGRTGCVELICRARVDYTARNLPRIKIFVFSFD